MLPSYLYYVIGVGALVLLGLTFLRPQTLKGYTAGPFISVSIVLAVLTCWWFAAPLAFAQGNPLWLFIPPVVVSVIAGIISASISMHPTIATIITAVVPTGGILIVGAMVMYTYIKEVPWSWVLSNFIYAWTLIAFPVMVGGFITTLVRQYLVYREEKRSAADESEDVAEDSNETEDTSETDDAAEDGNSEDVLISEKESLS